MAANSNDQRRRGPGRPFQPGQSGNPAGVSKAALEMREAFSRAAPEALEKLLEIMRSAPEAKDQRAAADSILDRAGLKGFAVEPTKIAATDADGNSIQVLEVRFVAPGGDTTPKG